MYRERYHLTLQRVLRQKIFVLAGLKSNSQTSSSSSGDSTVNEISTVASLLGSQDEKVLFGMITQPEENSWFLEDLSGVIKLDFSWCKMHSESYFYTEGSQVIVAGTMINSIFCVSFIALPPPETRQKTLEAYDIDDVFGNNTRPAQLNHLRELEEAAHDAMFIILSDVHFDKPHIIENLSKVFEGFEQTELIFYII